MGRRGNQPNPSGRVTGLCHPGINLSTWQLTALPRFCSLGHFDLNLLGADQIPGRNSKSSRRHLLDCRTSILVLRTWNQPLKALSPFSCIGLTSQPVHGNCQSLMCLLGNGAVGHSPGFKPFYNGLHALHLIQGNAPVFVILKIHQAP